jgi:hypothetical protein
MMTSEILAFKWDNRAFFTKAFGVRGQNSFEESVLSHSVRFCADTYMKRARLSSIDPETGTLIELYNAGGVRVVESWLNGEIETTAETLARALCAAQPREIRRVLCEEIPRGEGAEGAAAEVGRIAMRPAATPVVFV